MAALLVQHMAAPLVNVNPLGRGILAAAHRHVNIVTLVSMFSLTREKKTFSIYPSIWRPFPFAPPPSPGV